MGIIQVRMLQSRYLQPKFESIPLHSSQVFKLEARQIYGKSSFLGVLSYFLWLAAYVTNGHIQSQIVISIARYVEATVGPIIKTICT